MKKIFIILFLLITKLSLATHLYGGRIDYEHINGNTYKIIVTLYSNMLSMGTVSVDSLYFGDGSSPVGVPLSGFIDLPNDIRVSRFETTHTYSGSGTYAIHLTIPNLSADFVNVPHSVGVPMYLESILVINPFLCPFSSSHLLTTPVFTGPFHFDFISSHGAFDPNQDSLSYELIDFSTNPGYTIPLGITLNPFNGEFKWAGDSMYAVGKYYFILRTTKWFAGILAGSTEESFPVFVDSIADTLYGFNTSFYPSGHLSVISPGNNFNLHVEYFDSAATPQVDFYSEFFNQAMFNSSANNHIFSGDFNWTPTINDVRRAPYLLQFRGRPGATDLSYLIYVDGIPADSCRPLVSISEINADEINFELYPNPVKSTLNIKMDDAYFSGSVIITDASGKSVFNKIVFDSNKENLDVSSLSPGVYCLSLFSESFNKSKMFVVLK